MATLTMLEQSSNSKPENHGPQISRASSTETDNAASEGFDTKSALEIARIINHEDAKIAAAVKKALPEIAIVIDTVARSLRDGGRLIYVGARAPVDVSPPSMPRSAHQPTPRRRLKSSTLWRAAPRRSPRPRCE